MRDVIIVLAAALLLHMCDRIDAGRPAAALPAAYGPARLQTTGASLAAGQWRRRDMDGAPVLLFQGEGARPAAAIRCDRESAGLLVERMTVSPARGIASMTVTADNRVRTLPVLWDGASLPIAVAVLKLDDRMVDSLARSSGRIEIELGSEPLLTLPADPAIGALIADCRS